MSKSIIPTNAPEELLTIEYDGLTLSRPEFEDGFWFIVYWMFNGDIDIHGFCIADGDDAGFPYPDSQNAATALDDIMSHLKETTDRHIAEDGFNKPIPAIMWDAWVETSIWVNAAKLQELCDTANNN